MIMKIKKGDTVRIITGKDKGKEGKIIKAWPKNDRVLVEGANLVQRRERPRREGKKGQVVVKPGPIHVSNVKKIS